MPVLVPIKTKEDWVGELQGVSASSVSMNVFQGGKKKFSDSGDLMFAHFGLSGPLALNMSRGIGKLVSQSEDEIKLILDLKPIQDLLKMCKKNFGLVLPKITGFIIYVVAVTTLVVLSMRSFRLLKFIGTEKKKMLVFLSCLLYALALPRFKDYSFILLIVPTYYIIMKTDRVKSYALFFILTIISAKYITLPGLGIVYNFIWKYYPLLIAYFIFGVYICEISQMYRKEMLGSGKPALQPSKTQV